MIRLERVVDALPAGLNALRNEARGEGYRMLDTLAVEWESGAQRFARPGETLLAAFIADELVGVGGITLEATVSGAMRMRRFYVTCIQRRVGVGRALASALLDHARGRTITANAAAGSDAFWESFGFVADRRDGYTHIRR